MHKRSLTSGLLAVVVMLSPLPAAATFHIMVIQEVFAGYDQAPGAQYVVLRPQTNVQTFVHGQALPTFDATGTAAGDFAKFCTGSQCDLPMVSPACADGGCPTSFEGNNTPILVATPWARDLFCVTPDLLATGSLPYPDGRVCFGNARLFAGSCRATGAIDCVAYGQFTGDNGIFGSPTFAPSHGLVLEGDPTRPSQCNATASSATALCVGGTQANIPCTGAAGECTGGECRGCPAPNCGALLSNAAGFSQAEPPTPRNFHGDIGGLDGVLGNADGDGSLGAADIEQETVVIFEAGLRCSLEPERRGADSNLDTRLSAADIVSTIQLVNVA